MSSNLMHTEPATFDVRQIRQDFPILLREINGHPLVYLDNAASSQKPNQVLEAMDNYYQTRHANVHRGVHHLSQEATDAFEAARRTIAQFIHSPSASEVIFTRGTTESINLVAYTFGLSQLKAGDEIIVSALEHHSNIVPWQLVCNMRGASVKVIPISDDGVLDLDWLTLHLTEKTKLVAIAHVSNSLGTINPIKDIVRMAHAKDVPVLVDGAQALPHMQLDVQDLDADFYAFSSHKMYGPTGMGILYGKSSWLNILPPWQGGGEMIEEVKWTGTTFNKLPFKFEAGTPDIAGAIGLAAACEYLSDIDRQALYAHEQNILAYCTAKMESIPGIRTIGKAPHKAGVYSFLADGIHPYDLGTILDQQGVAVRTGHHCTQPLMDRFGIPGTVRASFACYTTFEEIDALVAGVEKALKILQ